MGGCSIVCRYARMVVLPNHPPPRPKPTPLSCLCSTGGTNSIMFAARHPAEVPKVVNLAGRFRTREGTLARFGADILERLAAEKGGIPRKEAWGEWVMTEQVWSCPLLAAVVAAVPALWQKLSSRLMARVCQQRGPTYLHLLTKPTPACACRTSWAASTWTWRAWPAAYRPPCACCACTAPQTKTLPGAAGNLVTDAM